MKVLMMATCMLAIAAPGPAQETFHDPQPYPSEHLRRLAIPSNRHNIGYWVGGGAFSFRRGHPPTDDQGTWGWDYRGWLIPRRVNLPWSNSRYQGGSGAYKTDGPRLPHLPHANGHK